MKKAPLILGIIGVVLSVVALFFAVRGSVNHAHKAAVEPGETVTAVAGDVVYISIDSLIMQYDMYSDLRSEFEAKAQSVQDDLNKKGRKLESDGKAFENQYTKGLLTRSAAEKQQESLLKRQQELQTLAAQKQQELQEEEAVMMNRVMDAIVTYLEAYNAEHNFTAIISKASVLVLGNPGLDITQEIVEGLNAEYIKNRNVKD
ncbi:MAG: OmpH family outer membrane protein [Bacteroidales bacterium]|nr:OmpH family outer membrane protein [Bacteroidales bacterium]